MKGQIKRTVVHARDETMRDEAVAIAILDTIDLAVSDAFRLMIVKVATEMLCERSDWKRNNGQGCEQSDRA
ncbi:MAG: hypothetical protein OXC62_08115 [Aestuariivita sp.]|nr:hypothetical protein [Aestuariivita sp.]